jgi:hypothetical protein
MAMPSKTTPGATTSKAGKRAGTKAAAGNPTSRDTVRRKPAPSKPKPTPTSGKRSEVTDAHDRYANIEVT